MDADIAAVREKYLNQQFDETEFFVDPEKTVEYARLCGETASRFVDPLDPDFQAPSNWVACLSERRMLLRISRVLASAWMQVKASMHSR